MFRICFDEAFLVKFGTTGTVIKKIGTPTNQLNRTKFNWLNIVLIEKDNLTPQWAVGINDQHERA